MIAWLLLSAAIVSEVAATLALKGALTHPELYGVVAVGYGVSFWLLTLVLRRMALGVTYGIWSAAGVASTAVMSWAIFDEPLTTQMLIGILLIVAGVLAIELGSRHRQPA